MLWWMDILMLVVAAVWGYGMGVADTERHMSKRERL